MEEKEEGMKGKEAWKRRRTGREEGEKGGMEEGGGEKGGVREGREEERRKVGREA